MVETLLSQRWAEARSRLGLLLSGVSLYFEFGDYPHFDTPRGYAVTFGAAGDKRCVIRAAMKTAWADPHRIDGIMRHEIGHVIDTTVPAPQLDAWAARRGVFLAHTCERRADDVARAVWGSSIRYDADLVQSTTHGVHPRPLHLGL